MKNIKIKNYKGFSLAESLIGVFIAATVFVTFLAILPGAISSEIIAKKTLIATHLAQEGVEKVRNRRDNNLKSGCDAFSTASEGCNFFDSAIIIEGDSILDDDSALAGFEREIEINLIPSDPSSREIVSKVSWNNGGTTREVEIIDILSAWGQKE